MEFDSFVRPVWQLPVYGGDSLGSDHVPKKAKYHCFVNGVSLCGKYNQATDAYDSGITIESGNVACSPDIACKRCLASWEKQYCIDDESPVDF